MKRRTFPTYLQVQVNTFLHPLFRSLDSVALAFGTTGFIHGMVTSSRLYLVIVSGQATGNSQQLSLVVEEIHQIVMCMVIM